MTDGGACPAGLPCPSHTAIAEHMLAAVSDPTMSQCLINHVDRKGPYAGVARVSETPSRAGMHAQEALQGAVACLPLLCLTDASRTGLQGCMPVLGSPAQ